MELGRYPHLFPPPDAIHFDLNNSFTFTQSVNPGTTTLLASVPIKPGYVGVIRYTDLFSSDFSQSYFSIYNGGSPMRNYVQITMPMVPEIPVVIDVLAGTALQLYGFATAAAIAGRYRLVGWLWQPRVGGK